MSTPSIHPESELLAQARGVLAWVLGNDDSDIEDRLAAGDPLAALQGPVAAGMILAPIPIHPGTLPRRGACWSAAELEATARGTVAVSLALHHLRPVAPPVP